MEKKINKKDFVLFGDFLKSITKRDGNFRYQKIPIDVIIDQNLTHSERTLLLIFMCFQFTSTSGVFPGRKRLAALMGIKYPPSISKITRSLQRKGYISKAYEGGLRVYKVRFNGNVDDSEFVKRARPKELVVDENNVFGKTDSDTGEEVSPAPP